MDHSREIGTLAGFFDGEGWVTITKTWVKHPKVWKKIGRPPGGLAHYHILRLGVGNTNQQAVERFREVYGGDIQCRKGKGKNKDCWVWRVSGERAYRVLTDFLPYLIVKRKQAEVALKFHSLGSFEGNVVPPMLQAQREYRREEIMALNRKGK